MPYKDREVQKEYQRKRLSRIRADWFKDKVCAQCGSTENLELDHINREDKVSHKIWSWSSDKRFKELAKCQSLCKECHKKKTAREVSGPRSPHGTLTMYRNFACRCVLCTEIHSTSLREWKLNTNYKGKG